MLKNFLSDIEEMSNKHTIYIHNLSSFDSLFLLKSLYNKFITKPLFKDNKIIYINIKKIIDKSNKINIHFKDSLLLLPIALDKLISAFNIETKKLPFPYKFVNKDNLNYIGDIPDYVYYSEKLTYKEYSELTSKYNYNTPWNLIEETKKYLYNDIKSLYEIIDKFGNEFYNIEKINITNVISISSLALNTFVSNYYDKDRTPIYIPKFKQYKDIKPAYFGGRVEVFKPYGENLYIYDVVSLYPSVMLNDMPIGKLIKSTDNNLNNYFGFCYASVEIPNNINKPILPFRDELGNVYNPVGTWTSMFNSEILKYARDYNNAKINIHYGYKFERGIDVFKNYINHYFELKKNSANNEGRKFLANLMLNSLYGRFGLKYQQSYTKIVTSELAKDISLKYQVLENYKFDEDNDLEFIKHTLDPSDILKDIDNKKYNEILNNKDNKNNEDFIIRSLPIAAMITGLASCFMNKFYNLPNNKCFYTDTDSIVLQHPLDSKYIGDNLGQFKFVGKIIRAYFIAPKLYYVLLDNGKEIIKSKGISNKFLTENDFIDMYHGVKKTIPINRFVKNLKESTSNFYEGNYIITPDILKRKPIYKNGIIIDTKPLDVINNKLKPINKTKIIYDIVKYNPNKYSLIISTFNL